jgi:hypothetical protein
MVIIRRELPRTSLADLAPHNVLEGSPPLPARPLTRSLRLCALGYAACAALNARSASRPIDQTKPASSRASAVTIFVLILLLFVSAQ